VHIKRHGEPQLSQEEEVDRIHTMFPRCTVPAQKGVSNDTVSNLNSLLADMVIMGRVKKIYADFGYTS
jgi:hypothetical protein